MNREELINIFKNTVEIGGKIPSISTTTKHNKSEPKSVKDIGIANILTINSDTVSTALEYSRMGKTCILNMASERKAGGGVINGAMAQEECLFRCSNLFKTVTQDLYPLGLDEALYTKNAVFFKDKNYGIIEPFKVDVVTVPALNLNSSNDYIKTYDILMKDKIRLMLSLAVKNDCKNIILGAWGCGVFANNPIDVANLFQEVFFERESKISPCYVNSFTNIVFAVINDRNSVSNNFDVFFNFFG